MKKVKDKQQDSEVKQARKENFKSKFILFIKGFICAVVMYAGFLLSYCAIWVKLDLPTTTPAMGVLIAQSVVSEILLFRWLAKDSE